MQPFLQLLNKEIYRFMSIWIQTVLGPLSTAILYQLIFGYQFAGVATGVANVGYIEFLIPGLIMLLVLQNSFANASSTLVQAKYTGHIIFVLMAPITPLATYLAYLFASIFRGIVVGCSVLIGIAWFGLHLPQHWWAVFYFFILGSAVTAGLGLIIGILADKFDQLAGFESFVIVPLIYLAGVFFHPNRLHGIWYQLSQLDPFLYIVDGFRYGFIGHFDANIKFGGIFVLVLAILINLIGYRLLKSGIKIKH